MCCFSGAVKHVSGTNIFARPVDGGRQLLAYGMTISADKQVAMILPVPVPAGAADDAVRFIDLKGYPDFFEHLLIGFPEDSLPRSASKSAPVTAAIMKPKLEVVAVGDFEASFVPTIADFSRLDERFRLPASTWDKLPGYKGFGFVVFKLKKLDGTLHPMAFEFPRANPAKLFFPTVHIHDGDVHPKADFDHVLYCQKDSEGRPSLPEWRESLYVARSFMNLERAAGLIDGGAHCYQRKMKGERVNEDILA